MLHQGPWTLYLDGLDIPRLALYIFPIVQPDRLNYMNCICILQVSGPVVQRWVSPYHALYSWQQTSNIFKTGIHPVEGIIWFCWFELLHGELCTRFPPKLKPYKWQLFNRYTSHSFMYIYSLDYIYMNLMLLYVTYSTDFFSFL